MEMGHVSTSDANYSITNYNTHVQCIQELSSNDSSDARVSNTRWSNPTSSTVLQFQEGNNVQSPQSADDRLNATVSSEVQQACKHTFKLP